MIGGLFYRAAKQVSMLQAPKPKPKKVRRTDEEKGGYRTFRSGAKATVALAPPAWLIKFFAGADDDEDAPLDPLNPANAYRRFDNDGHGARGNAADYDAGAWPSLQL